VPDPIDADPLPPPASRGPLSAWTIARVWQLTGAEEDPPPVAGGGFGDDLQLALYLAYEGHFSELGTVDEWDPALIDFRRRLEDAFVVELQRRAGRGGRRKARQRVDPSRAIPALIDADTGPSLSRYMEAHGTLDQMRDVALHRSAYQLKEGDAHTLGISRLRGRAKQLLAAIQAGEYGADEPDRIMHSELFAQTMRGLGLDDRPNAHLDRLPASALMVSNLISMFGLNRRWRGALVGHLAVFEMTSVVPMGRYARALQRLGADADTRRFYEVHVMADAEHEHMALDMACALAGDEPALLDDILFGARAVLAVEREFAETLLRSWGALAVAA
jgi:hypothetical protein